ncbi:phage baseplate assembly protein V [Pantoea rodasii]|uniref:Phage baseplate assembly protein V n=1 Tax=Pantoea rodasii TaxID=1076549 RepID=A0A2M9WHL1_9GAMM|nr:phage baseplate assembly protein V [Pantoea rodasii]ORM62211.1 phage baseplate protein [Pantoea rodasii]PJZ07017.1 phage baseplate assembly protein V [Pantoea rodasii]
MDIIGTLNRRIASALAAIRLPFRAALSRLTSTGGVMTAQLEGLAGETLQEVEVFQHYGLTSVPPEGAMAIVIPLGGLTSHGIVVATEHSEYRIQALNPGEVAIYNSDGASITLKNGKAIHAECDAFTADCKTWRVNASESAIFDTPELTATKRATVKGLLTGSGGMSISNGNGDGNGAVASFAGSIDHTSGTLSSVSVTINGVGVGPHIHPTPDGDSGPMKAG